MSVHSLTTEAWVPFDGLTQGWDGDVCACRGEAEEVLSEWDLREKLDSNQPISLNNELLVTSPHVGVTHTRKNGSGVTHTR